MARADRRRMLRKRMKWLVTEIKRVSKCSVCGKHRKKSCLTFHHRDKTQKVFTIGYKLGKNITWRKLLNELRKCDIVCRECHEAIHRREN
jgi:hypothetical protein